MSGLHAFHFSTVLTLLTETLLRSRRQNRTQSCDQGGSLGVVDWRKEGQTQEGEGEEHEREEIRSEKSIWFKFFSHRMSVAMIHEIDTPFVAF